GDVARVGEGRTWHTRGEKVVVGQPYETLAAVRQHVPIGRQVGRAGETAGHADDRDHGDAPASPRVREGGRIWRRRAARARPASTAFASTSPAIAAARAATVGSRNRSTTASRLPSCSASLRCRRTMWSEVAPQSNRFWRGCTGWPSTSAASAATLPVSASLDPAPVEEGSTRGRSAPRSTLPLVLSGREGTK